MRSQRPHIVVVGGGFSRLARTNNPPPARQCRLTADGV